MRFSPIRAFRARRVDRTRSRMAGPALVRGFAEAYPSVAFAEIGANDGNQHDFLRPFIEAGGWTGLMVEPVPYVFDRLRERYERVPGVSLENVAVGPTEEERPFYHLAEAPDRQREGLPEWYDGIGSFSRDEVVAHRSQIPDIDERVVERMVPTVPLDTLCRRSGIAALDLILIDTEGYDWQIIRSLELDAWNPRLLIYEHYHLSRDDRRACREHLHGHGYETMEEHFDTFCLDTRTGDDLTRLWHRLEPAVPGVAAYEEGA